MIDLTALTLAQAAAAIGAGDLSPVDLTRAYLDRIERLDPLVNAYIAVSADAAMADARAAEREIVASGARGRLHGIPYALKDIIDAAGLPTTAQSRVLAVTAAPHDATVTARLREAGAILLGKLALHEFAVGGPTFDLPYPPARNPWNLAHHPGGSSSGPGAALAAHLTLAAVGTDTGGSIRNPATCCGIVGLKPTYGLVSRAGVFPLSFSLDHVGPMARNVEDCAILLAAMAGSDARDPSSVSPPPVDYDVTLRAGVEGTRIGVVAHLFEGEGADDDMVSAFDATLDTFRALGATLVPVTLPALAEFARCGRVIQQAESFAIHRRWLAEHPERYCELSLVKLAAGAFLSAADYIEAQQERRSLCERYDAALAGVDCVVTLSGFHAPSRLDDPGAIGRTYDRHARMPFNVAGAPAIAVPAGFSASGLPLGFQIAGRAFDEATILRVAFAYEQACGWTRRAPPDLAEQAAA